MQFVTKKTEKVGQCNNFHDETGTELYEKLLKFKGKASAKIGLSEV